MFVTYTIITRGFAYRHCMYDILNFLNINNHLNIKLYIATVFIDLLDVDWRARYRVK